MTAAPLLRPTVARTRQGAVRDAGRVRSLQTFTRPTPAWGAPNGAGQAPRGRVASGVRRLPRRAAASTPSTGPCRLPLRRVVDEEGDRGSDMARRCRGPLLLACAATALGRQAGLDPVPDAVRVLADVGVTELGGSVGDVPANGLGYLSTRTARRALPSRRRKRHNGAMPSVQIKDVPADTHAVLRQRAAAAHQSLQEYLRRRLIAEASRPTIDEVLERASGRSGGSVPLAAASEELRAERARR